MYYVGAFSFELNPALNSSSGSFLKKIEESQEEKKPSVIISTMAQQFCEGRLRETEPATS